MRPNPPWAAFAGGLAESLSIAAGYLPIAFSFGLVSLRLGLPEWQPLAMSVLVYAGASQFVMASLLASGASAVMVAGVVILMNLRHVFYGPSLLSRLALPPSSLPRALLAFGLTDEVFALASSRAARLSTPHSDYWLLGLQLGAYLSWVGGTALGVGLGASLGVLPGALEHGFQFVLPALFLALVLELRTAAPRLLLPLVVLATLGAALLVPGHVALLVAMATGAGVALLAPLRRRGPGEGGA